MSKTKPLEQEMRLKWNAVEVRKLKDSLKGASKAGEEGFKKTDKEASKLEKTLGRMKTAAIGFITSLGFGAAITAIGRVNGQLEQMRVAFNVMLGDAKKGGAVLKDIFDFTETTPFQFDEVAQAGRTLLAMGGNAANLKDELKLVGDVAAGTGQSIVEIASIFGKIRAKQRLTAEEMMQLAERGVPIYEELEKITGQSGEAMNKLVETGKIRFPILEQVFRNLTSEGGKFAGMMEMQSKTFLGMVSTLKDMGLAGFREATGRLFELLKSDIEGLKKRIEEMRSNGELEAWTQRVAHGLNELYQTIKLVVGWLIQNREAILSLARAYVAYRVALVGISAAQAVYNGVMIAGRVAVNAYRLALVAYRHATIAAKIATNSLKAAMAGSGIGLLAVAVGMAAEAIWRFTRNTEDSFETVDIYRQKLAEARGEMEKMTEAELKNAEAKAYSATMQELKNRALLSSELIDAEREKKREEANLRELNKRSRLPVVSTEALTAANDEVDRINDALEKSRLLVVEYTAEWEAARQLLERFRAGENPGKDPYVFDPTAGGKPAKLKLENPVLVALEEVFGSATGDFEAKMNELRIKLARGIISEEEFRDQARKVAEEFRDQFAFMLDAGNAGVIGDVNFAEILGRDLTESELRALREAYLEAFGDVKKVLDDTEEKTEDLKDKTKALVTTVRSIKSAVNGVRQMANAFGFLGDKVNQTLDGLMNTADAITSIYETRALIAEGELKGGAATASLVSGYVGVASSVVGMLSGIFKRSSKDQVDATKENTRRIEKAIEELAQSLRFGEDLSGEDIAEIASALLVAGGFASGASWDDENLAPQFNASATRQYLDNLFDMMEEAGIDPTGFRNRAGGYVGAVNMADNRAEFDRTKSALLAFIGEIRSLLNPLLGGIGMFNPQTAGGVLGRSGYLSSLGGASEREAFDDMVQGLLALEGLSGDMRDFLEDIAEMSDPLSPGGREAIKAMVERIAREVASGSFFFGSLTPSEVDEILQAFSGFGQELGAEDEFTRSVQIARSITEIQANELIAIQETALMYLRDIRDSLSQTPTLSRTSTGPLLPGRTVEAGDIYLTVNSEGSIENTMRLIEVKLREAERNGAYVRR